VNPAFRDQETFGKSVNNWREAAGGGTNQLGYKLRAIGARLPWPRNSSRRCRQMPRRRRAAIPMTPRPTTIRAYVCGSGTVDVSVDVSTRVTSVVSLIVNDSVYVPAPSAFVIAA